MGADSFRAMLQRAVILDRDGTIIEDRHYLKDPHGVELIPNAVEGLKRMREKGFLLFVLSNQSGVGRGLITSDQFWAVHKRVCEVLQAEKVEIDEFAFCFHRPEDECGCRKPKTDLVRKEWKGQAIDWKNSYVVGDSPCDIELADALGGKGLLVLSGKGGKTRISHPAYPAFADLLAVAVSL